MKLTPQGWLYSYYSQAEEMHMSDDAPLTCLAFLPVKIVEGACHIAPRAVVDR